MSHLRSMLFVLASHALLLISPAAAVDEPRAWTDPSGTTLAQAEFVSVQGASIHLREANGRQREIAFSDLSTLDQDWLRQRLQRSGTRNVTRSDPPFRRREPGGKWALLVGVDEYGHLTDLQHCQHDVLQLRERLERLGFPRDQIIVLHDDAKSADRLPTRANIQAWIDRLLQGSLESEEGNVRVEPRLVGPQDMIVFGFSGHGMLMDGTSYFCPPAASLADPQSPMVSTSYLYRRLAAVPNGLRLLLVDACRDARPSADATAAGGTFRIGQDLPRGVLVLASCDEGQTSQEYTALEHGVFTYALQAALGGVGVTPDRDGRVSVKLLDVVTFVVNYVGDYTKSRQRAQTPHMIGHFADNPLLGTLAEADVMNIDDLEPVVPPGPLAETY